MQTGVFPLYEVENGETYTINVKPREKKPIADYIRLQGRFRHLKDEEIQFMQQEVDKSWERLLKRAEQK